MSKMSQLNLELQEQANELGFSTVQEALDNGYEVVMHCENGVCEHRLRKESEMVAKREKYYAERDAEIALYEQEAAHKAWLKEKEEVLEELESLLTFNKDDAHTPYEVSYMLEKSLDKVKHAIDFIKKGEV